MKKEETKTFLLKLPASLHKKLKLYSIEKDKMIRDLIVEAITEFFKDRKVL